MALYDVDTFVSLRSQADDSSGNDAVNSFHPEGGEEDSAIGDAVAFAAAQVSDVLSVVSDMVSAVAPWGSSEDLCGDEDECLKKCEHQRGGVSAGESAPSLSRETQPADANCGLLLYEVSADAPWPRDCHTCAPSRRRARALPLNSSGISFGNDTFEGVMLMWHRVPNGSERGDSQRYFNGKTRLWEVRLQGRFKRCLSGTLWGGVVLEECDYRIPPSASANVLARMTLPLVELALGQGLYFSWGDRETHAAQASEPELAHLVGKAQGFDQIIRTAAGEDPPPLNGDLTDLGIRRNALGMGEYSIRMNEMLDTIGANVQDTYTFCFWGASRFYNAIDGLVLGLLPFSSIDMNSFMEGYPLHLAFYELDHCCDGADAVKHLESRKRYVFDLLSCNAASRCSPWSERYIFADGNVESRLHDRRQSCAKTVATRKEHRCFSPLVRLLSSVSHSVCSGCNPRASS